MRVVLVTAAYGRPAVTRLALAQWAHLKGVLGGRGHETTAVVVADDENLDVAREHGFHTVEQNNEFLGRRFNDGIEHACVHLDADVVVPIGSDDWIHPDAFNTLPEPETIIGGEWVAFVHLPTGRMRLTRAKGQGKAIPWLIPRKLLEPSNFRPVNQKQVRGLDYSLRQGLARHRITVDGAHQFARVDFKSGVNINSFDEITGRQPVRDIPNPRETLLEHYPESLVGMVL